MIHQSRNNGEEEEGGDKQMKAMGYFWRLELKKNEKTNATGVIFEQIRRIFGIIKK